MKKQKTKNKKQKSINMHYLLLLLLFLISTGLCSQSVENINLPTVDRGGSMIGDILHANGKIFTYSADGISIYDATNNLFIKKVIFNETLGKFNPVYHNAGLAVPDLSFMVYNNKSGHEYIYALTPKLKLLIINTNSPYNYWTTSLKVKETGDDLYLEEQLESQNGRVILKYDDNNNHDRLYVMLNSRDANHNCTGNFHEQKTIFGIYTVDYNVLPNDPNHTNLHYSEINTPDPAGLYGDQINNYVFNEENNYFYIVRLGRHEHQGPDYVSKSIIEIREVTPDGSVLIQSIDFINVGGSSFSKMGKMLYINEGSVHKIIVLPYKYFVGSVPSPRFCVIDGNTHGVKIVNSPSKKILDAVYLEQNQDLVLSYAPNNNDIVYANPNTNIAVFHYNSSNDEFEMAQQFVDDNSTVTSDFDINPPLYLTKLNGATALISKKDGIAKLEYNNSLYNYSLLLGAEGNFFNEGVVAGTKTFINNTVANGMEIFENNTGQFQNSIRTGYPVYHITANSDGSKLYFYNKLNSYNTGLYSYNAESGSSININHDNIDDNNIETAIGDVVYNPFQDHFLISKFEHGNAKILVLNATDNSYSNITIDLGAELPGTQFAKEMFISPNGRLYIWANMNNDPDQNPTVFIYDATTTNYSSVYNQTITDFDFTNYDEDFSYYTAHDSYNPHDESVYTTITVQEQKLLPYNTEASSIYNKNSSTPPGKLLVIKDAIEKEFNLVDYPGKVIYPGLEGGGPSSQYYGKLFIIGENLYEYDYLNPPTYWWQIPVHDHNFIDITYSTVHDKLFAVKESTLTCSEHRIFEIWTINYTRAGDLQVELYNTDYLPHIDGQIANIFSNPYDGRVYVYQKVDAAKLGDNQVSLYSFNPSDENPVWDITPLGFATYFPDYDHTRDLSHFFFYNITTPYIDPYNSFIYLPNGGHSCVSRITFEEALSLSPGINWISIPRHEGNGSPQYDPWPTETVFAKTNFGTQYSQLSLKHNYVTSDDEEFINATYNLIVPDDWDYEGDMNNTYSYRGYKLKIFQQNPNTLSLSGNLENPTTPIELFGGKHNWVGYFLYQQQDIFDALGYTTHYLFKIEAEDWFCVFTGPFRNPNNPQPGNNGWICSDEVHNINYGQMVVLTTDYLPPDYTSFTWQGGSRRIGGRPKAEAKYFTYTETAGYTPVIVLLDSTENPAELGAFINDSCVGACTVLPGDTLVGIRAYMDGQAGDSLTFEARYNTKSTAREQIKTYYVYNPHKQLYEQKCIRKGEGRDYYKVSFRKPNLPGNSMATGLLNLQVYPNPANNMLNIDYNIVEPAKMNISVFDSFGRQVATILNTSQPAGLHGIQWNLTGNNGEKLPEGLYIIKLKIDDNVVSKKVVVN